jgi:hypothetical protein
LNSVASIRQGYTFSSIQLSVLHHGSETFKTTVPYPAGHVVATIGHIGDTVQLLLIHHTNPACGGFGELAVFGHAISSGPTTAASPPNLTESWVLATDPSSPPWHLTASGAGLSTLDATWTGCGSHSGLRGTFHGTLSTRSGAFFYTGTMHVDEGATHVDGTMVFGFNSPSTFLVSYRQSNGVQQSNLQFKRSG